MSALRYRGPLRDQTFNRSTIPPPPPAPWIPCGVASVYIMAPGNGPHSDEDSADEKCDLPLTINNLYAGRQPLALTTGLTDIRTDSTQKNMVGNMKIRAQKSF